ALRGRDRRQRQLQDPRSAAGRLRRRALAGEAGEGDAEGEHQGEVGDQGRLEDGGEVARPFALAYGPRPALAVGRGLCFGSSDGRPLAGCPPQPLRAQSWIASCSSAFTASGAKEPSTEFAARRA